MFRVLTVIGRVFKRYDQTCPRCIELSNGAKPLKGWGMSYNYQMRVGRGPAYEAFKRALKDSRNTNSK